MHILKTVALLACSTLQAGNILISIACHDAQQAPITGSTTCVGPETSASASASVTGLFWSLTSEAVYSGSGEGPTYWSRASGSFDASYLLTLHGGSGLGFGFVVPILDISYHSGYLAASGTASAAFGPVALLGVGDGSQSSAGISPGIPLAFDTPTLFHLTLFVGAYADNSNNHPVGGYASAKFEGITVVDASGGTISGATFTLAEVPEPSTLLVVIPLIGIGAAYARRRRCQG